MFDCIIKSCLRGKNIQQHEEIHQKHTVENILDISNYSGHHMSGKVYIKAQKKSDHQKNQPDDGRLFKVFFERFPVTPESIGFFIPCHLNGDIVHGCKISSDGYNRNTHYNKDKIKDH